MGDNQLTFDHFYIGFMAPYFGCYRCADSQLGLKALDMDNSGAFVYRGGGEIAKFAIFRDNSRNWRFSAKYSEINNFPRQIAI